MATKKKTTVKRKTNATKKAKDKQMMQTHAMEEKESFERTTLDQIWGDQGFSKYGTLSESDYIGQIKGMNKTDLHAHAVKMGILPVENRELLSNRLVREFKKYVLAYKKPKPKPNKKSSKPSDKVKSILAEGR